MDIYAIGQSMSEDILTNSDITHDAKLATLRFGDFYYTEPFDENLAFQVEPILWEDIISVRDMSTYGCYKNCTNNHNRELISWTFRKKREDENYILVPDLFPKYAHEKLKKVVESDWVLVRLWKY
jgi:hypothetical protein